MNSLTEAGMESHSQHKLSKKEKKTTGHGNQILRWTDIIISRMTKTQRKWCVTTTPQSSSAKLPTMLDETDK